MKRNSGPVKSLAFFSIIFLTFLSTVSGQAGSAPVVSLPQFPGPLAIDGFLQRQGIAGDWLAGPAGSNNIIFTDGGTGLIPLSRLVTDKYNSSLDETFSKAFLQDDPNKMKWTLRRATSKTDLSNFLVVFALNPVDNHIWVVLASDRRSTGKNSSIDLELLQNQVLMTGDINSNNDKGFYSAGPHGGRTVGDITISVTFQNNEGSFGSVRYFQWQPGSIAGDFAYFPLNPGINDAFAAFNSVPINVPFGAFGSSTYAPYTFAEAAIDVTTLIGGTGLPSECESLPLKSIWVKSKSNDNYDDFIPPFQFEGAFGFPLAVDYFFLDLYTAQLNAVVSPNDPADFNFHWTPMGATNGIVLDRSITGSLNDYDIPNPIFSADTNYDCIAYIYRVSVSRKSNPGCIIAETDVVINSPCKIGKPINPDQMHQGEVLPEGGASSISELKVFPNPAKGSTIVTMSGENGPKDITLLDMKGAVVRRWSGVTTNSLQLKNLPAGLYLLKVYSNETRKTETKKIMIHN